MKFFNAVIIFLLFSNSTIAQSLFKNTINKESENSKNIDLSGFSRGSIYAGSSAFDFSSVFGEFGLKAKLLNNNAFLFADLRIRNGLFFNQLKTEVELKEVYAGFQSEKFGFFIGQQIVTWGRTDGFNPTNNITPNNYFFLSSDPDNQKTPNFLIRSKIQFSPKIDLDLIGIPFYKSSIYRYDLYNFEEKVSFSNSKLPAKSFENIAFASRLNFEFSNAGFSFSWFRGFNPFYAYRINKISFLSGNPVIDYMAESYLKNTIGADIAVPIKSFILRTEVAYNITKNFSDSINIPFPNLEYVCGLETSINGINIIIQYVGKYNFQFHNLIKPILANPVDPVAQIEFAHESIFYETTSFVRKIFNQQEKNNHAISFTAIKSFAFESLKTEFNAYYNFTSKDFLIRPKVVWIISDNLTISLGCFYANGPKNSLFNYSSKVLNGIFSELKVSF